MDATKAHTIEVWAQLLLCDQDCARIRDFFVSEFGLKRSSVVRRMHITVYHARRPMPGVTSVSETTRVVLPATETRFMVLAPGGENPRPELDPVNQMVGIRIRKQSAVLPVILEFRDRLLQHETERVLGSRAPSNRKRNAFGARHYQPHMAVLRAGSRIDRNLIRVGIPFREALGDLTFDRFAIDVVRRLASLP
jgi:hypothetical protein